MGPSVPEGLPFGSGSFGELLSQRFGCASNQLKPRTTRFCRELTSIPFNWRLPLLLVNVSNCLMSFASPAVIPARLTALRDR